MPQIFISYSSQDRDVARSIATALTGFKVAGVAPQVWWDRADDGLHAGDDYWRKIADALEQSDAAIVLWSDNSLASDWVYSEACRAKGTRKIVPISLSGRLSGPPPMPFDVLHTLEFAGLVDLQHIVSAIEARLARRPLPIANGRRAAELNLDVLELKRDPMPADAIFGPGDFLKARNQTGFIDFLDGNGSLEEFLNWSRRPPELSQGRSALARLVHAAGGFGKTRLLIELAVRLEHEGWLVGFIPRGLVGGAREAVLQRLIESGRTAAGLLLVIDYVEQRKVDAEWIAEQLSARATELNRQPARFVMLARGVGEWWQSWLDETPALQRLVALAPPLPGKSATYDVIRLPSTFPSADRIDLFDSSFSAFRHQIRDAVPHVPPASDALVSMIQSDPRYSRPLAIQMAALLYAYGYDPATGGMDIADLLNKILGLERDHWSRALNLGSEGEHKKEKKTSAIGRAAAQTTLCLGVSGREQTIKLIRRDPNLALMSDVDVVDVYSFLTKLYPGEDYGVAPLEPDLLGEHHVTTVCDDAIVDTCLGLGADNEELRRSILTVLNRASRSEHGSYGHEAHRQLARLVRERSAELASDLVHVAVTTPGRLREEIEKYPALRTIALREQALMLDRSKDDAGGVIALASMQNGVLVSGTSDNLLRLWDPKTGATIASLEGHAGGISALAVLSDGRVASGSLGNTIKVWDFSDGNRTCHTFSDTGGVTSLAALPDGYLAAGFLDKSARLYESKKGNLIARLEGHSGAVRAMIGLPLGLLATGSDDGTVRIWDFSSGSEVARLVGHKGPVLALARLSDQCLASGSEDRTMRLWDVRSFAEQRIIEGHSGTVSALTRLADGRLASGSLDQTIRFWDPSSGSETARLEGFTGAINALALLSDGQLVSGNADSTIVFWDVEKGVETARLDGRARANQMIPAAADELATASRQARAAAKQASRLSQLGQRERAVEEASHAVDLYRTLSEGRRGDFLPDLAARLTDLSVYLAGAGRREAALQAAREASDIYRELSKLNAEAFLPELAVSLNNLGSMLSNIGRAEEALQASREAISLRRRLVAQRPDTFLPALASSLNNTGAMLANIGRRSEALEASREALDIYRKLAVERPDAFLPDLASGLNNISSHFATVGQYEEALAASQEAITIRRKLADERPDQYIPDLAGSLNNAAALMSNAERHEEALAASQEAVAIYRQLASHNFEAFGANLASSLNNLGLVLSKLGRREEAVNASQESVGLFKALAKDLPEAFSSDLTASVGDLDIRENNGARLPCALVLDRSASMLGDPIRRLNAAVEQLKRALDSDANARRRVQLLTLSFGGAVSVEAGWRDVANFDPPQLVAGGDTPLGTATIEALKLIEQQVDTYKRHGIPYMRPWMVIITDGQPTDAGWEECAERIRASVIAKKLLVFPFGVEGADLPKLARFQAPGGVVFDASGVDYRDLFQWLSRSTSTASRGVGNHQLEAPPGRMVVVST